MKGGALKSIFKWLMIIRPFTLPASLAPVVVGLTCAAAVAPLKVIPAVVTALCAVFLQVLSNLVNDYYDFKRGSDSKDRLGPPRAISEGKITTRQLKIAIFIDLALAISSGVYLIIVGGWQILAIGVSALFFAWLYSATSRSLSHLGIADLFTITYYGFVAGMGTTFIQTGEWSLPSFWLGLGCGAIATGILTVNNVRDIEQDRLAGKKTLVVRLGKTFGKIYYLICLAVPVALTFIFLPGWIGEVLVCALAALLYALFLRSDGRKYNKILMFTGFFNLIYSLTTLAQLF